MYQYSTQDYYELLEESGFIVGDGSYSDICELDGLEIAAFNFGVAYYKYHSLEAYMKVDEYLACVARFVEFYNKHKDTKLEHEYDESSVYYLPYGYYGTTGLLTNDRSEDICPGCGLRAIKSYDKEFLAEFGVCIDCDEFLAKYGNDTLRKWLSRQDYY